MDQDEINAEIGKKIRELRRRNDLTQQDLADRAELTKGFISQLERGQVSPSVVTLMDLIECLGSTPGEFFREESDPQIVFEENDYFEKFDEAGNQTEWLIPPAQRFEMEPIRVTIEPHQSLEADEPHAGEEFGYVLSGRISLTYGEKTYSVRAGESFYYRTTKRHRIANPGSRPARLIWISTPPMF